MDSTKTKNGKKTTADIQYTRTGLDEVMKSQHPVGINTDKGKLLKSKEGNLMTPEDFTSPEDLYQELKSRVLRYHPSDDLTMIEKAYRVAEAAHREQKRKSGEPYIIHPLCVGIILADLEMDKETIAAGILHDVVEDTVMTVDEIRQEFGDDVALLVDGVTKLNKLDFANRECHYHKTCRPAAQHAHPRVYAQGEAAGESIGDDGYLCSDRTEAGYFPH